MWFLRGLLVCALIALVACAAVLPESGEKARVMDGLGKLVYGAFAALALGYFWQLRKWFRRGTPKKPAPRARLGKPIVVDGSNVMHWGAIRRSWYCSG